MTHITNIQTLVTSKAIEVGKKILTNKMCTIFFILFLISTGLSPLRMKYII
jgi:hypothetical protein